MSARNVPDVVGKGSDHAALMNGRAASWIQVRGRRTRGLAFPPVGGDDVRRLPPSSGGMASNQLGEPWQR
jgi:hypothetical protein